MKFDRKLTASTIKIAFILSTLAFFISTLAFFFIGEALILPNANGVRAALNISFHMLGSIYFVMFIKKELYNA